MRLPLVAVKAVCLCLLLPRADAMVALPDGQLAAVDSIAPSLDPVGLEGIARQVDQVLGSAEINSAQQFVQETQSVDKALFDQGVDRISVGGTDFFSNHLVTSPEALEIAAQGELFLRASNTTATNIGAKVTDLERIPSARLPVGLRPFCPFSAPIDCSSAAGSRYRTIDGSCNNVAKPYYGKTNTPFQRLLPPLYADGVSTPRETSILSGVPLPGARQISTTFHGDSSPANEMQDISHMSMEFGQFLSHDIQRNALSKGYANSNLDCCNPRSAFRNGCFPIKVPTNDPFFSAYGRTCLNFVRAVATPSLDCSLGPRQQLNQNTHYLDGSQVYGSDTRTSSSLRTFSGGRLKTDSAPGLSNLLPKDQTNAANCILPSNNPQVKCFKAGDVRANQQPALMAMHTVFLREHNRIAAKLQSLNPTWSDQQLYDESRKIVGAILQHITYSEYLPDLLGPAAMTANNLKPLTSGYFTGYDSTRNAAIYNGFSAAAFRFGHSMVRKRMTNVGGSSPNILLKDVFLNPSMIYETSGGIDAVARGLINEHAQKVDRLMTDQLTNHLFERTPGFGGDLAATNIQRGRDHGIPFYQMWRQFCGLSGPFSHDLSTIVRLTSLYPTPVDIDLFTGGVSETPVPGGKMGPTFACIIGKQFESLKKRDRYYYENSGQQSFELGQLNEIRQQTLAKVLCRNTGITSLQKNVFIKDVTVSNPQVSCSSLPDIDFDSWRCAGWLPWGPFTGCFGGFKFRIRSCWTNNPRPCSANSNPCPGDAFELVTCLSGPIRRPAPGQIGAEVDSFVPEVDRSQVEANIRKLLASGSADNIPPEQILRSAVSSASERISPVLREQIQLPLGQAIP